MDKQELKIQALREALRERVSLITDEYENRIVDLRIELTEMDMALQQALARLEQDEQVGTLSEEEN